MSTASSNTASVSTPGASAESPASVVNQKSLWCEFYLWLAKMTGQSSCEEFSEKLSRRSWAQSDGSLAIPVMRGLTLQTLLKALHRAGIVLNSTRPFLDSGTGSFCSGGKIWEVAEEYTAEIKQEVIETAISVGKLAVDGFAFLLYLAREVVFLGRRNLNFTNISCVNKADLKRPLRVSSCRQGLGTRAIFLEMDFA